MASCRETNVCGTVKYPAQQVGIKSDCDVFNAPTGDKYLFEEAHVLWGAQSIGYDTNFDQTPIFTIGQGEIYEINEGIPSIDVTVNKALDGYSPAYLMATKDADKPTLFGRAPQFSNIAVSIFPCTVDSANGVAKATVLFKDAQVNSVSYTFGTDNVFTEDVSFRSNNVLWNNPNGHPGHGNCASGGCTLSAQFESDIYTLSFPGYNTTNDKRPNGKLQFREDLIFGYDPLSGLDENCQVNDPDATILPPEVYGISPSGSNDDDICIQSISVSVDLGREDILCLGTRGPRNRTLTLPVSVTTTIETVSECGDNVSGTEYGVCANNLYPSGSLCSNVGINSPNRTIRIATCDGLRIYTGLRNKLSGSSTQGGGADGGDLTVTYTFTTFNTFTVMHENDLSPSGAAWWTNRDQYLTDI